MSASPEQLRRDEISHENPEDTYDLIEPIGEGSFGLICLCMNVKTLQTVAIKFLDITDEDEQMLQRELDILKDNAGCVQIVQYFGSYIAEKQLLIVMEYADGGSTLDLMRYCDKKFSEDELSAILYDCCLGIAHLHKNNTIHRDMKAGNVLLASDGHAKLADFGVSAKLSSKISKRHTTIGSPYWMAPEVITVARDGSAGDGYDEKADIWSLGITAIELADGEPPLFNIPAMKVLFVIPESKSPTLQDPSKWSKEFNEFVDKCCAKDSKKRPSVMELLELDFIKKNGKSNFDKGIIKSLVSDCMPTLKTVRSKKMAEKFEDATGETANTAKNVSTITVNQQTKTFVATNKK